MQKSFVKRERVLKNVKKKIFDDFLPQYEIKSKDINILLSQLSYQNVPVILEIGFGNGENLFFLAKSYPKQFFLGIEVYKPGIAHLLSLLKICPLDNIKICYNDATHVLEKYTTNLIFDKILILFPDPWPKHRHHKRRLIQESFVEILYKKLKLNGIIHIATDNEDYCTHSQKIFSKNVNFIPESKLYRLIKTKFERRGIKNGNIIFDTLWRKI